MERRKDFFQISTTQMVEDIFFREWGKKETSSSNPQRSRKRKNVGGPIVEWVKYPNYRDKMYIKYARVGDEFINEGDNVKIPAEEKGAPPQIALIAYMFDDPDDGDKMFHGHFYCRGIDTILGDKSDPRELFLVDHCENIPLSRIIGKAKVHQKEYSKNWQISGGIDRPKINDSDDGINYYFSKRYDYEYSRFVDFINVSKARCMSCHWQKQEEQRDAASIQFYEESMGQSFVKWRDEKYFVGTGVFIDYERSTVSKTKGVVKEKKVIDDNPKRINIEKASNVDGEIMCPEKYRNVHKRPEYLDNPCEPYTVGVIEEIRKNKTVIIREFYRELDTGDKKCGNPFLVFRTDEMYTIRNLNKWKTVVKGKCYVLSKNHITDVYQWIKEGPFRFYYEQQYCPRKRIFKKLPPKAENSDTRTRRKSRTFRCETAPPWPEIKRKLKSMDIYAGCGGLSDGLERAGLVETKWAIEINSSAAKAFKLNHPNALVKEEDCNDILSLLLEGKNAKINMPEKGEVEIIVGGPPCQGYSGLNRFKRAKSAEENNLQINTYLGFVDYYRPNIIITENVRNFATSNKTDYLKLTLKCLLEIGYQITFGVLQAGNYGVPQSRRRFFIIGAAPGQKLPNLPEPTHCFRCFKKRIESIAVDGLKYDTGDSAIGSFGSLPYGRVTIRDAIEDLPHIDYETMSEEMPYQEKPDISFYAKHLREYCNRSDIVTDHMCNYASAIVRTRISMIPEGGDWSDLPDVRLTLDDGTITDILDCSYRTKDQRINPLSGVGACAEGKRRNKIVKNSKSVTLIPRSIAHTVDRNNNWKGVYGRLIWDAHFPTIITNPEPSGTQGRVIHPEQHRILSVREYARAQGFHDEFLFAGSTPEKYRQIGNAVPPILATAIGREIVKTLASQNKK